MVENENPLAMLDQFPKFLDKVASDAVLAERERCAKIAEGYDIEVPGSVAIFIYA